MCTQPSVSVIMPAYGAVETIEQSIKSVQGQSIESWELIIVDDGSPDATGHIARKATISDARIRVISQANAGPSAARNNGLSHAQSSVIAFLDADDAWAPERLEGMLAEFAARPDVGVLFSRTRFMDEKAEIRGTLTSFIPELSAADLLAENAVCSTSNIICRKAVLEDCGHFTNGLNYAEDQEWLVRVALDGRWRICGIDAEWFFYRSAPNSQSADLEAMRGGWRGMVQDAASAFPDATAQAAKSAFGPFHRHLARRALRMGQPFAALRYLARGLHKDPGMLLRQPKRTALTVIGAFIALIPHPVFKELVAK